MRSLEMCLATTISVAGVRWAGWLFADAREMCRKACAWMAKNHCRAMIEVSGLTKCYGEFTAVNDLSFTVRPGEVLGLLGPNGAGKTTTLRCLTGIIPPTRGTIRLGGCDLATDPVAAKRRMAFFPDEPRLFDNLSVWQHLVFTARVYQVADFEPRGRALLQQLAIADKADAMPGELSRGMKQKLTLACGLLHAPEVVLFDEPLTGLDPAGIRSMKETMRRLAREGAALILSSHLLSLLEEVCTHVLILKNGLKVAAGSLEDVHRSFAAHADASLEDIFFTVTDGTTPPLPLPVNVSVADVSSSPPEPPPLPVARPSDARAPDQP